MKTAKDGRLAARSKKCRSSKVVAILSLLPMFAQPSVVQCTVAAVCMSPGDASPDFGQPRLLVFASDCERCRWS
jgi:hypothetical protein